MSEQDKIKESCEHIFIGKPPFCSKCGARKPEQEKLKVPFEVRTFNDNAGRVLVCLLPIDGAAAARVPYFAIYKRAISGASAA